MKTLSQIIQENENNKKFKYNASVLVEGHVYANSEGDAGELIDKEMDSIPGFVSGEIINISEETSENYINDDLSFVTENSDTLQDKLKNKLKEAINTLRNEMNILDRELADINKGSSIYLTDEDEILNLTERCEKIIEYLDNLQ